ncbi:3'-5' exoribonuclease domain-containing protein [Rhodococcus sp. NPDC057297]|uniref:3'-5' exoribonuclease domain-containing protein n=1 Tax=Rhodococcus sp. NPDC057297 TaxID=3346090 RepID=UPI00363EFF80
MKYFYDTEFLDDGRTIELISIGIVSSDGREYYAVNSEMPEDRIKNDRWLCENVIPSLPLNGREPKVNKHTSGNGYYWSLDRRSTIVKPKWVIANEVREFLLDGEGEPELWAWYAAYDHVVLAQLFGKMIHLPKGLPMYTNDLKQEAHRLGDPELPEQEVGEHNALADARHLKRRYEALLGGRP